MTDLFSFNLEKNKSSYQPLSERLRPESLDDFVGQDHVVGEGKLLNRLIKADKLRSMIFYGPPGTGKTTLANIIAKTTSNNFREISAVSAGVKDIRQIVEIAEEDLKIYNKKTILFVDEIHRFNKSQQDGLLPHVEKGLIILIGATTENPLFEVNKALLSRSTIIEFKDLNEDNLNTIIDRALTDKDKAYGSEDIIMDQETRDFLISHVEGDARNLINTLELAFLTTDKNTKGQIVIDKDVLSNCIQRVNLRYDKLGDMHYDIISAFIKSIRGSQIDAAIYYLALMLESGEDPMFIARRLVISASEDIGLADPSALSLAVSTQEAVKFIGMPEARIPLAQATIYLAAAPKSNTAYKAINSAIQDVKNNPSLSVPKNLKNIAIGKRSEEETYRYSHDYKDGIDGQKYLQEDKKYYYAKDIGYEKNIKERLEKIIDKTKEEKD